MAVAIISLPNAASVGLHESMGFRRTGVLEGIGHKFGRWIDDDVRQMEIQPMPADPPGPIPSIHLLGTLEGDSSMESGAAPLKA
jgi:phosphinothricin acetyltransferase